MQIPPDVLYARSYTFSNPNSANGPMGSFTINFNTGIGGTGVHGPIMIQSMDGGGFATHLMFLGSVETDAATGYVNIAAKSSGYAETSVPPQKYPISGALVGITLPPDGHTGTISVDGIIANLPCKLVTTTIHH